MPMLFAELSGRENRAFFASSALAAHPAQMPTDLRLLSLDPRQPDIEEWIAGLPSRERLVVVPAFRAVFRRCANDPVWGVWVRVALDELKPTNAVSSDR
jgi:hypothetical protein